MSAFNPRQAINVCYWHLADIQRGLIDCPLSGIKQTSTNLAYAA
jgi:hypothetical protein